MKEYESGVPRVDPPPEMDRAAWLAARKCGLGASEVAAVVGLSQYETPLHVFLRKTGRLEVKGDSEAMGLGRHFEHAIASAYARRYGEAVTNPPPIIFHPEHRHLFASLDRLTERGGAAVPLEIKMAGTREGWGPEGSDEVPAGYYLQAQHQMFVGGYGEAVIAALLGGVGGHELRRYLIPRREDVLGRVLPILHDFWGKVERLEEPELDWEHPATPALVASLYGVTEGRAAELGPEEMELARRYVAAKSQARESEEHAEELKSRLIYALGGAATGNLPETGWRVSMKLVRRAAYSVEATEYHTFRVYCPKPKEG